MVFFLVILHSWSFWSLEHYIHHCTFRDTSDCLHCCTSLIEYDYLIFLCNKNCHVECSFSFVFLFIFINKIVNIRLFDCFGELGHVVVYLWLPKRRTVFAFDFQNTRWPLIVSETMFSSIFHRFRIGNGIHTHYLRRQSMTIMKFISR